MIERARRVLVFAGYHRPQKSRFSWKDDAAGTVTVRYTRHRWVRLLFHRFLLPPNRRAVFVIEQSFAELALSAWNCMLGIDTATFGVSARVG